MRLVAKTMIPLVAALTLSVYSSADSEYLLDASMITASALFEQTLVESSLVAVKPEVFDISIDAQQVSAQCLWSINVELGAAQPVFSPGKMICVGPNQEVLEVIPQGEINPFGECLDANCSQFKVGSAQSVTMALSAPLVLTLQPRNERK